MIRKKILSFVFLLSYAGAIAHSIIPHHHHDTQQEAKEHHHHDHHSHSHSSDDASQEQGTYLLTHSANSDVFINHASIDNFLKVKKSDLNVAILKEIILYTEIQANIVFHPPKVDFLIKASSYSFRLLRAPPATIA